MESIPSRGGVTPDRRVVNTKPRVLASGQQVSATSKTFAAMARLLRHSTAVVVSGAGRLLFWNARKEFFMETAGTVGLRAGFAAIVAVMLAIDLFMVGGGRERRVSFREAATWSVVWIAITLAFAGAWLIIQFHWILYIFGAFLRVTGIKMY
jgi:hypothetical protein